METAVQHTNGQQLNVSDDVRKAAIEYANGRAEWWTREWDLLRSAFEAGAFYQKPIEHELTPNSIK